MNGVQIKKKRETVIINSKKIETGKKIFFQPPKEKIRFLFTVEFFRPPPLFLLYGEENGKKRNFSEK